MRHKISWGIGDTEEGSQAFATEMEAAVFVHTDFDDFCLTPEQRHELFTTGQLTFPNNIGVADAVEWVRYEQGFNVAYGLLNTPADKKFANSSPVWTGITARILAGFKGVHPNA